MLGRWETRQYARRLSSAQCEIGGRQQRRTRRTGGRSRNGNCVGFLPGFRKWEPERSRRRTTRLSRRRLYSKHTCRQGEGHSNRRRQCTNTRTAGDTLEQPLQYRTRRRRVVSEVLLPDGGGRTRLSSLLRGRWKADRLRVAGRGEKKSRL